MSINVTAETTTEVAIAPELQAQLRRELKAYAAIKAELQSLEADIAAMAAHIEKIRDLSGARTVNIDGYGKITRVEGSIIRKIDKRKLLAHGIPLSVIDHDLSTNTPRKAYTLISLPGSRKDHNEDE